MIDDEALRELRERPGQEIRPEDAAAVDGAAHHEIAESQRARDVSHGGRVDDYGEGRALVGTVDCLAAAGGDDSAERVERGEGALSLGGHHVCRLCLDNPSKNNCFNAMIGSLPFCELINI